VIRYLCDRQAILATFTETGRERTRYTPGPGIDKPLAELRRKQRTFYHADVLGSILALTDAQGRPLRAYQYKAFGSLEDHRGDRQPFRFTGREWDKEIKLYYYRARYYDPPAGRFLQEDPIGLPVGKANLFLFVGNKPVNLTDPSGLQAAPAIPWSPVGPMAPPFPPVLSQPLTPDQVRSFHEDMEKIGRLFDPRPLANYLLSKVLEKIDRGEPLTKEDIENLGKAPESKCEVGTPSSPPPGPQPPTPPKNPWLRALYYAIRILEVIYRSRL